MRKGPPRTSERGDLFVLEGPDGTGKSTLAQALVEHLNAVGIDCEYLAFPGRIAGTVGHLVYQVHHRPEKYGVRSIHPLTLQLLHVAAHVEAIDGQILPLLRSGRSVVLDRFWWSTWVYGLVAGVNQTALKAILRAEQVQWGRTQPKVAFVITRRTPLRPDEPLNRWHLLSAAYHELAEAQQRRHPVAVIQNEGSVFDALQEILRHIARPGGPWPAGTLEKDGSEAGGLACRAPQQGASATWPPPRMHGAISADGAGQLPLALSSETNRSWASASAPTVLIRLEAVEPTEVLDTYWRFAAERQAIFFRKLEGKSPPWTMDSILRRHKFTNAYRAADRVSQYLIRHVIYEGDPYPEEVFFRTLLFKIFNRIETWEILQRKLRTLRYAEYSFERYDSVLNPLVREGKPIFSAAYIMPSGETNSSFPRKHQHYLRLLETMMAERLPERLTQAPSMKQAYELLRSYRTIGSFLAYQYVTDLNYSELTHFSETEFVVPGPGARDGIRKCFRNLGGRSEADVIRMMAEHQEEEFARLGLQFRSLWGRPLQLIDCQNLFCEVDKYARVAHPEIRGISGRERIKQIYQPGRPPIDYWFPPKWGLNERIERERRNHVPSV